MQVAESWNETYCSIGEAETDTAESFVGLRRAPSTCKSGYILIDIVHALVSFMAAYPTFYCQTHQLSAQYHLCTGDIYMTGMICAHVFMEFDW